MVALRDLGVPAIEGQRQEILAQVDEALSEDEQSKPYSAPARELVSRMLDVAVGFLKQTDSASIGASLSNDGIGVTILTDFVPDSYSADLVGNLRPQGVAADDSLISGIPQGSYLLLAGSVGNGEAVAGAIEDLLAPVRPKLEGTGEAGEAIESYLDALLKQVRATERSTAGMLRPTGPLMGGEGLFRIVSVMSGNSQDIVQGYKEMMLVQQDIMKAVASAMPEASASMNMQATVAENATTVDGVSFDKITSTFGGDPNDPQAAQVKQMMQIMYGPEGQTTYLGKVDEKTSVMVMGSQALLADAVAAAKAKTDPLAAAPNVAAVSQKLPGQRISVGYIMLGDIVATALGFAQQFGAPFNVQIPENLPPVGMSMSTQEPAVRTDVFIHSKLVEALVGAGMQVMMQMQGGGQQPGGPEGL
jgi:hypothetical protein